jgi:hypothetical protein
MKKYFGVLFLIMVIIPSVAFASWWNPLSWKIFKKKEPAPQVQVINTEKEKTPEEKIAELQKQLDELKNENKSVEPKKENNTEKKVEINKTTSAVSIKNTEQTNKLSEQAKAEAELKAKFAEQDALINKQRAEEKARLEAIDAQNALGKNYYFDAKIRVNTLIGIENSYKAWLQDTSNQFRSASLTLAGYNTGGLYGEARDLSIKLANGEISVLSTLMARANKDISSLEEVKSMLANDSKMFITEATFNQFPTPNNVEADVESVKKHTNEILEQVLLSLQYH